MSTEPGDRDGDVNILVGVDADDEYPCGEGRGSDCKFALDGWLARPCLGQGYDSLGMIVDVDRVGIERPASPLDHLGMVFVLQIGDGLEELGIAPRTADVLGRAAPHGVDQERVCQAGDGIRDALDLDRVLPAVSEVLEVAQGLRAGVLDDVQETRLAGIEGAFAPVRVGNAPAHIAGTDLVEMAVGPAHGGLEHKVQAIEPD